MDKRAIGIFDSGIGGLTALKAVNEIMPSEDVVYFGDTKNVPYGEKSREEVIRCANYNIDFLSSKNVKVVLAACGTVSSQLKYIKSDIPVFGIIDATCRKAVKTSKSGNIGVLATSRTVKSGVYKSTCLSVSQEVSVSEYACPKLATLIENGHTDCNDEELTDVLNEYLKEIKLSDIDVLILGCTHYAVVEEAIKSVLGNKNIVLINAGEEAAKHLEKFINERGLRTDSGKRSGTREYYISGDRAKFIRAASKYLEDNIDGVTFSVE